MKNKINNKLLTVTIVATIAMNGCASRSLIVNTDSNNIHKPVHKPVMLPPVHKTVSKWKSLKKSKNEKCVNCYASFAKKTKDRVAIASNVPTTVYRYDYSQAPVDTYAQNEYQNPYKVDASYHEDIINRQNSYETLYDEVNKHPSGVNNSNLIAKNSIQVGAFRRYAGAKVYAKRYSLLTNRYNVNIKENVKDNRPIYRVQIEGFANETEAREFMNRYGLDGAFLVRR